MPARSLDDLPSLTPLQLAIYETDLLDLTLRDSMRLVTSRMGYFVGQHRYLEERVKIARLIERYGPPGPGGGWDPVKEPREAAPQVGSP
jgi:hypothetical protein